MPGKHPNHWAVTSLGELNRYTSKIVDPASFSHETFELYSVPSFPTSKPEIVKGNKIGSSKQEVIPGDVLICKINPRINRVWEVFPYSEYRKIASSEWIIVRIPELSSAFLRHYFSSPDFRALIEEGVIGVGGSLTRAQPKRVEGFLVPLPPLNEQKRIVDKLDSLLTRVDSCRAHLDRVPEILKRFRQAVLAAAVSGQLTEVWRKEKNKDLSEWSETTIGEVGKVFLGRQRSPKNHVGPYMRKYVRAANVTWNGWDFSDVKEMNFDPEDFEIYKLQVGDILLNEGSGSADEVGKPAIWKGEIEDCCFQNTLICVRPYAALSEYLYFLFLYKALSRTFVKETRGINIFHIGKANLAALKIILPPIEEQHEIVRRIEILLASLDRLQKHYKLIHTSVEELIPALLSKAFLGELVPQDPNDEPATVLLERIRANRAAAENIKKPKPPEDAAQRRTRSEELMLKLSEISSTHLTDILNQRGPLTAEKLWSASQLEIEDFYDQLKEEELRGLLREIRNLDNDLVRMIEAI